jgi:hypothetical protein
MMRFPLAIGLTLAILACGFAPRADAQPPSPTDRELRSAMEEILARDEFRHFDHLARSPATVPETSAEPAKTDSVTEESSPAQPSWWELLRQRTATKKESTSGSSDSQSTRGTASRDAGRPASDGGSNEASTPSESADSTSAPTSDGTQRSTPQRTDEGPRGDAGSSARPQREAASTSPATRGGRPSQRGSDGIERPVRYAPRTAARSRDSSPPTSSNWGSGLFSGMGMFFGQLMHLFAYAVLAAVCVLIIALAARAIAESWQHRRRRERGLDAAVAPLAHDRSPGETAADVFLQQALRSAQLGDYRAALGQLLLGAMSWIERKDWIRYRRGLTVRDYLRSIRSKPEQYDGLKVVVEAYEPVEFGRHPATQPLFESALAGYRAGFEAIRE